MNLNHYILYMFYFFYIKSITILIYISTNLHFCHIKKILLKKYKNIILCFIFIKVMSAYFLFIIITIVKIN